MQEAENYKKTRLYTLTSYSGVHFSPNKVCFILLEVELKGLFNGIFQFEKKLLQLYSIKDYGWRGQQLM
jgi:hypothetical protein